MRPGEILANSGRREGKKKLFGKGHTKEEEEEEADAPFLYNFWKKGGEAGGTCWEREG